MSKDYYQQALKGTRETALEAVRQIEADFERYGSSGDKNARKHQIIFTFNVLAGICRNCEALRKTAHYDLYVYLFTKVFAPKLDPTANPSAWRRLLPSLEYIFLTLAGYQLYGEAYKLYGCLSEMQLEWPDIDDLKYLLNIHGGEMQMLLKQTETNAADDIKQHVSEVFIAMEKLFDDMIKRYRETPIDCTALLNRFVSSIITTRSTVHKQLATTMHCAQMDNMNKKFFELLSMNSKFVSSKDPATIFQVHIDAVRQFLQIDRYSKLQQNLALQHMRIVRDMKFTQENKYIGYCCTLLYNLLKLAYLQVRIGDFKDLFSQLSQKFCKLLKSAGEVLMQEVWFQDFFILIFFLLFAMHTSASNVFQVFWQHMDASLYVALIKFIKELLELTPRITKLKLIQFNCCKNPNNWFHIQLDYTQFALENYTKLLKLHTKDLNVETNFGTDFVLSLNAEISTILKNSIDTLISMEHECTKSAESIRKLCVTFRILLQEANYSTHALSLISLAKDMTRLKSRIPIEDWLSILFRVYKIALICGDANIVADILSCYIAELICHQKQLDLLHSLVHNYHLGRPGNCLLDIYVQSTSTFKSSLQKRERRIYHWVEMQYVSKFYDREKDRAIFMTLAQRSEAKYDFINAVRAGKLIDQPSIFTKVQNIYDLLISAKRSGSASKRLQELTLAHTICLLLFKSFEDQKIKMTSKDFLENNFEQLFQEKLLLSLSATKEMERIEMALEAIQAFKIFFNRADVEPLQMNDGNFLDWMRILEDIVDLAVYFQANGYLDYAVEAWLLHYRVASTIDDVQSSLRSLAFFCEYNMFFENDLRLDLSKEIDNKSENLMHILENLPQLLRRQQNFALNCACQIAYYYASQKKLYEAHTLLLHVKHLHKNKLKRQDYDIVLFTADIVSFRILWRHRKIVKFINSKTSTPKECIQGDTCLLKEIGEITERMHTYVEVSSADKWPYTLLLLSSIDEFAEYALNRLSDIFLSNFLSFALRLCVESGMAVRAAQLLCRWVLINLQMENLPRAEIKMQIIECILGVRDIKKLASSLNAASCAITASKQLQVNYNYELEEARKVAVLSIPFLAKEKNYLLLKALDHKLENCNFPKENEKSHRLSHVVLWTRFTLSCLRARFNFLSHHYTDLHNFYENCEKWLEKRKNTFHFQAFQSIVLVCMLNYANYLRANKDYEKAIKHLKMCIEHCAIQEGKVDEACLINFEIQLKDTKFEQLENTTRNLPTKENIHSLGVLLNKLEMTPAAKPSKYAALPMTTYKKPSSMCTVKSTAFVIYSDRKSPRKAQVKHTKPLTAIKGLKFNESTSSSGSESSAECKTRQKIDFNACQMIEMSDSDCDVEFGALTESKGVAKMKKSVTELTQQKKPKFNFFESVELADSTPSKKTLTKENTIAKRTHLKREDNFETQIIVNEMQNLAIKKNAAISKTDTEKTGIRRHSPQLASQNDVLGIPTASHTQIDIRDDPPMPSNRIRTKKTLSTLKTAELATHSDRKSPRKPKKDLAEMKGSTFNESSSSSGNESSAESKTKKKMNLNACHQVVELSDSDCDVKSDESKDSKLFAKMKKFSTKQSQQIKPKFKFLDSIELEDSVPSKTTVTKNKKISKRTKIQRNEYFYDEIIVDEMQNLAIEKTVSDTTKKGTNLASPMDISPVPITASTQIDIRNDSPLVSNVATTSSNIKKRSSKRTKTPQPTSTVASSLTVSSNTLNILTPEVTTSSNRFRGRQAETDHTVQASISSTPTYSLRRRQRN